MDFLFDLFTQKIKFKEIYAACDLLRSFLDKNFAFAYLMKGEVILFLPKKN